MKFSELIKNGYVKRELNKYDLEYKYLKKEKPDLLNGKMSDISEYCIKNGYSKQYDFGDEM